MTSVQATVSAAVTPMPVFHHRGPFSESMIASTSESLRARLMMLGTEASRARKIFSSYVELAYNIVHYGQAEPTLGRRRRGDILVELREQDYAITSRNRVSNTDADLLSARLDHLRAMSMEEIRFEYRLRLTNLQFEPEVAHSKGAGLGLITVARNAARPLEYSLQWNDKDRDGCQFNIHTVI